MIIFAYINPLFEWQINEIVTDFPSSYKVRISPSPWTAWLGDALNDKSYVFKKIYVEENGKACSVNDLSSVVRRSRKDELLEQLSLTRQFNEDAIYWATWWIFVEIALSVVYILWFTIWHEHRPVSHAMIAAVLATMSFCLIMIPMMRLMGPRISFGGIANCQGAIIFSAKLSKMYYSVSLLLFTGIFAELAALVMMTRQVARMASKGRESSKLAVG